MFLASCLDYFCQGNLIGRERATAEGGLVQSKVPSLYTNMQRFVFPHQRRVCDPQRGLMAPWPP